MPKPFPWRHGPRPGQPLVSIGNAFNVRGDEATGVLSQYAGGNVRQVYDRDYHFDSGQEVRAKTVEITVPLNPGDSGGPILNRAGELVGISSAITRDQNQIQNGIDISEIRAFLAANKLTVTEPKSPTPSK